MCIVLTAAALYFTSDTNNLVIQPISNMLIKIRKIGENPLKAVEIEEANALAKELVDEKTTNKEDTNNTSLTRKNCLGSKP